jgi:hypothetical protein
MNLVGQILRASTLALLLVACNKAGDDNACPADVQEGTVRQTLMDQPPGSAGDLDAGGQSGGNRDPLLDPGSGTPDNGTISDDGDDEADNEGPNKRGRAN